MAEQTPSSVSIKGIRDGLLVSLDDRGAWAEMVRALAAQIDAQAAFFQGARVTVHMGERKVRAAGLSALRDALSDRGVGLEVILSENPTTLKAAQLLGMETRREDASSYEELEPINTEAAGSEGVLVRQTLRSGGTVRHSGHVVVIGDINPGAKIIAGGDVVVWGRLRGMVHAGAYGDEAAVVCALDLSPTQLRIAEYIAISPPGERGQLPRPEVASVHDGQITASLWKPGYR